MDVSIKLNERPKGSDKVNVDLQWFVKVTKEKPGWWPKKFRKFNNIDHPLQLNITDIVIPDEVVCDRTKLFSIIYDGNVVEQEALPLDVTIKGMNTSFQLLFDKSMIKDCTRQQDANPRKYPIKFNVKIIDHNNKDKEICSKEGEINLIFQPLGVEPQYKIKVDNSSIQYSSALTREQVGSFETWINEDFEFTPDQLETIKVELYKGDDNVSRFVSFDDGAREVEDIEVTHGNGNENKKTFPIYVDFTNISNPIDNSEKYTIQISIVRSARYAPEVTKAILIQDEFSLLKDQQGTELKVLINMAGKQYILDDSAHTLPPFEMNVVPRNPLMGQVEVSLLNIATDNTDKKAGLYIKNLTFQESLLDNNVQVIGENNTIIKQFVKIDGHDKDGMCSVNGHFIPNGPNAKSTISVSFDPTEIIDVLNTNDYTFSVRSILTFDYYEDRDGAGLDEEQLQQESVSIKWTLHLEPNPEWLCVDYGSSAIVCKYDDTILNLKERKDFLFRDALAGIKSDNYEKGTPFLSSDIVLHAVIGSSRSTLCSQQPADANTPYLDLSVCLSPTSGLVSQEVRRQLPCLKILVGNEFLPSKGDYQTFQYARLDKNNQLSTVVAEQVKDEETCLLRVSSIFHEAYAALFKYFIQPVCNDKSVNKLVVTYPNTYTPVHLKVLEDIVHMTFPKVRDGYLRFVSESDAVAAYYVYNWSKYNSNKNINDDETILVYDMGAGTLDITLLKKYEHRGKILVDILGKIGTGRAGNYLDYLICEILRDKVPGLVDGRDIVSTKDSFTTQILDDRLELKDVAKNRIKPNLASEKTIRYKGKDVNVDGSIIARDRRFTKYLTEVTYDIIHQLLSFVNDDNLTIDTVLMSGRGCRLEELTKGMKRAIRDRLGHTNVEIKKIEYDSNKEKTAVVEGAMAYASIYSTPKSPVTIRSRRLYASYGLIYKRVGQNFCYVELLNSADFPLVEDASRVNNYEGQNVNVMGTAGCSSIKLVQTYLSPSDTEQAYNASNYEFITEMQEYNMAAFPNANALNVKLKIDYKNNIYLYVNGMLSTGTPPRGVDINSEITKRSIWPVTI